MEFIISEEKIAEWKRLADAATPGPWVSLWPSYVLGDYNEKPRKVCHLLPGAIDNENAVNDAKFIADARLAVPALLAEREQFLIEIRERDESDALFEKMVMSAVRRAGELLGKGNYDNIDHAAERVVKERNALREFVVAYDEWAFSSGYGGNKFDAMLSARDKLQGVLDGLKI